MDKENDIKKNDGLKQSPFTVPNGYFDTLPDKIMQRCAAQPKATKISLWNRYKTAISLVAGFLILAGIANFALNVVSSVKPETRNYLSQVATPEVQPIVSADEMNEDVQNEIIAYLVDEQVTPIMFDEETE